MKRLSLALGVTALTLAACGGSSNAVAATVNGEEITVGDVESLLFVESGTIPIDQFARFLGFQIQLLIVDQALVEDFDIQISEEDITVEADRLYDSLKEEGETREDFTNGRGFTEEFLRRVSYQNLVDEALREAFGVTVESPTDEEVAAAREEGMANVTEVCVSHILVATEDEADAVFDRLEAGEEFAALAIELSTDTGSGANGGDLGCASAGRYVPEFRDASVIAPIGEVYDMAVASQFGFHVILVNDRTPPDESEIPTDEEIIANLELTAVGEDMTAWFDNQIASAVVTVDEKYGTWQTTPEPTVVPPAA